MTPADLEAIRARNEERKSDDDYFEYAVGVGPGQLNGGPGSSEDIDALLAEVERLNASVNCVFCDGERENGTGPFCCDHVSIEAMPARQRRVTDRMLAARDACSIGDTRFDLRENFVRQVIDLQPDPHSLGWVFYPQCTLCTHAYECHRTGKPYAYPYAADAGEIAACRCCALTRDVPVRVLLRVKPS